MFLPFLFPCEAPEETALLSRMARRPGLVDLDEQRVLVAVIQDILDLLDMTGCFPFLPELLSRTAPEPCKSRLHGLSYRSCVHVGDHEHFAGLPVLDHGGNQPFFIILEVFGDFHAGLLS